MKRILIALLTLAAVPLFAGVTYDFKSVSSGMGERTLAGAVSVESPNLRMDFKTGDGLLFKDGSFVISSDGGKTLQVFDPDAKTYYVMNINDILNNTGAMLNSLGGKLSFGNPKVNVKDLGDAAPLSGYPTRHALLEAAYDMSIEAMGNKMTMRMTMNTESWTTDKLGAEFTNFMQTKSLRTGYPELDKLIEAQSGALNGRFPLKQVTTIHITQNGGDMTTTTTSEVTNIVKKTIAPATFAAPAGYSKVDDPLARMMKNTGAASPR